MIPNQFVRNRKNKTKNQANKFLKTRLTNKTKLTRENQKPVLAPFSNPFLLIHGMSKKGFCKHCTVHYKNISSFNN